MKQIYKTLILAVMMVFMASITPVDSIACGMREQDEKVLTDLDCPGGTGQIYKKCEDMEDKCCRARDATSCPTVGGV